MPAEKLSGAPSLPKFNTPKPQPAGSVTRNAEPLARSRSWQGKTAGEVSQEVLRQIQENPDKAEEIFAKMKARGEKDFAQRVNEVGGGLGPVGRGAVRGAEGIGRFAVNSFLRGMSYIPGLEDWSNQADHNNRLAQIQAAYDTYQDETGRTSEFIGADLSRLSGTLGETASQMILLGGASKAAGVNTKMGMTKFMAASYGAMETERSLTTAKDAGYRGWQANAYAAGNGAITAGLTLAVGKFADKMGANTADQMLATGGGRLASRLMSWTGLKELAIDAGFEAGEEGATQLAQNLWAAAFKMKDWDQFAEGVPEAALGGALTSGVLGTGQKLKTRFNEAVAKIPSVVKGFKAAQEVAETGVKTPEMEEQAKADPDYAKSFDAETATQAQYKADAEELGIVDKTRGEIAKTDAEIAALKEQRDGLEFADEDTEEAGPTQAFVSRPEDEIRVFGMADEGHGTPVETIYEEPENDALLSFIHRAEPTKLLKNRPGYYIASLGAGVKRKGAATRLLTKALDRADAEGLPVGLIPSANADDGGMTQDQLEAFYRAHGFVDTPEGMLYEPGTRRKQPDKIGPFEKELAKVKSELSELGNAENPNPDRIEGLKRREKDLVTLVEQAKAAKKRADEESKQAEAALNEKKGQLEAEQKAKQEDTATKQRQAEEMMKRDDARRSAADVAELASVQHKRIQEALREHGIESLPEAQKRKFADTLQQVYDEGLHFQVMEIVHKTDQENDVWNAKTKVAVREGIRMKQHELNRISTFIDSAPEMSLAVEEAIAREKILDEEITYALMIAHEQQSEAGFAFVISRFGGSDGEIAVRRAERIKGGPLTDAEKKQIMDAAKEAQAVADKINEGIATKEEIEEMNKAGKRIKKELTGEQQEEVRENKPREKKLSTEAEQVQKVLKDFAEYDPTEDAEKLTRTEFQKLLSRVERVLYDERSSEADVDAMTEGMESLLKLADTSGNFSAEDKAVFAADVEATKSKIPHEAWKLRQVVSDYESGKVKNKLDRPEFDKLLGSVRGILNSDKTTDDEKTSALNSARRLLDLAASDTSDFSPEDKAALASDIETLSKQIKERRRLDRMNRVLFDVAKIKRTIERLKNYDPNAPKAQVAADELDTLLAQTRKIYADPNATQEDRDVLYASVEALESLATQLGGARPGTPEYEALREEYFIAKHNLSKVQYIRADKTVADKVKTGIRIWHESVLSGDLSHMGIQSGMMAVMRPSKYVKAMVEGFKGVKSESEMKTFYKHMTGEFGDLYREGAITLNQPDGALSLGEDAGYRGAEDLVRKFSPQAADQIARLQRVYRMGVNAARVGTFEDIVKSWGGRGNFSKEELFAIGSFTDALTLRGGRGYLDKAVRGLQLGFLAPRNYAAYLELASLYHIWKPGQPGKVRMAVAWEYGKMLRGWASFATAAMVANFFSNLAGNGNVAEVEIDPLNKRFMQMKIGNTWIDPSIRLGSYLNIAARSTRAAKTSITQEKLSQKTGSAYDAMAISSFLRGKESFPVGLFHDFKEGENIVGEPSTIPNVLVNRFTPIAPREILKAAIEGGGPEPLMDSIIEITGFRADFDDPKRRKKNKKK